MLVFYEELNKQHIGEPSWKPRLGNVARTKLVMFSGPEDV